jgi:HD-GYP domain-containing protein (c-di-GMP phosphodiesterase class II)
MSLRTRTVLARDLIASDGRRIGAKGELVDLSTLRQVARLAPRYRELPLWRTALADSVLAAFEEPALAHLVGTEEPRAQVAEVLSAVQFPTPLWEELGIVRAEDPARFQHAVWSALVASRLFCTALGSDVGVARVVGGALVHDLGMRVAAGALRENADHLTRAEAEALEDHPLLGALLVAAVLGDAPAVQFALLHHLGARVPPGPSHRPLRGIDVLGVSSAFAALVAPRPFRPDPFSPRGAVDQLMEESSDGRFDLRAVLLLVHCMRGAVGPRAELKLPTILTGYRPLRNQYGLAAAG